MSHLACADEPEHPLNAAAARPLRRGSRAAAGAPGVSFANSSGIFLGPDYHFDLVRPGVCALRRRARAAAAQSDGASRSICKARILQMRDVDSRHDRRLRCDARRQPDARSRPSAVGYADGYLRAPAGSRASAYIGDIRGAAGRAGLDGPDHPRCHRRCRADRSGPATWST